MPSRALEQDSLVLVAGGTGFIGSAISRVLLQNGYKVRAATRSLENARGVKELLDKAHPGRFELVQVNDWAAKGAYDDALKGADGFVVVAADVTFNTDTDAVIKASRTAIEHVLESAKKASVKRVVVTSSRIAQFNPQEDDDYEVTDSTWYDSVIETAKATPADHAWKPILNYAAGKVAAERTAFDWVKKHQPGFILNTVLPDFTVGENVSASRSTTAAWVVDLLHDRPGKSYALAFTENASFYSNVDDVARVHLAALVEPDVKNERLHVYAAPFTVNDILAVWRKHWPQHQVPDDFTGSYDKHTKIRIASKRSLELLKRQGQDGWTPFEQTIVENMTGFA